jgi:23S rRNA U2552 (ribose-2'-O)-methylase RlmE/FtsJ
MNDYETIHINARNKPYTNYGIAKYSPISRAFFKLWEIIHDIPNLLDMITVDKPFYMGGLAEGPGGFIECISHIRRNIPSSNNDKYYGITLRPTTSHIPGWRRHLPNLRVSYGADGTGNLYNPDNLINFRSIVCEDVESLDLVTADGGFDFSSDYEHQETTIKQLLYAEIMGAMLTLRRGGTFILKIFDCFEPATMDLLWILACRFDTVYITKPYSSRPANSEKYAVGVGFRGLADSDIDEHLAMLREDINGSSRIISTGLPDWFKNVIDHINTHFCYNQYKHILKTLISIEKRLGDTEQIREFRRLQGIYGLMWCKKYDI